VAKKIQLRLIIVLLAALALRLALTAREVRVAAGYTLDRVPVQLGAQVAVDLPLSPFEVELLAPEGGKILQRRYGQGSNSVWLAAVQSRHDWRVQHPPQICYTAQGWRIEEDGPHTLPSGERVQRMVVQKGAARRVVYYLYTDGRHWTASYFWRIFHALFDRAVHAQVSTWAMLQLSTPQDSAGAESRLANACAGLLKQP
jgi:EpsI family protein